MEPESKKEVRKMAITFYDYQEAIEYVKQKREEGYVCEICGGLHYKGQREKHIVKIIGRIPAKPTRYTTQRFSPYRKTDPLLSCDTIVRQFKQEGKLPLRSKEYIKRLATKMMEEAGVPTVDIKVKTPEGERHLDAAVSYSEYTEKGKKKFLPILLTIHPIHQYSNKVTLVETIRHEIEHIKEKE